MSVTAAAVVVGVLLAQQAPVDPSIDPSALALRDTVQHYYDAQAQRDPEQTLSFWSASANPRPTREAFLAVFGEPAEDTFSVDVRAIEMKGGEARVRVAASRTRLIMRGGTPVTQRTTFLNSQLWRKEPAGWRLLRDGPFAEEIADDLIAAAPENRAALLEKHRTDLVQTRMAISQRATMAITLARDYVRGRSLFELALEVSRAANDRPGEANSLHNLGQIGYFLREYPLAIGFYERELALGVEIGDQNITSAAQFGLATVAYSRADYTTAIGLYREALAVYERREDPSAIGRALVSIGNVQFLQADYDAATASYRRALGALESASDRQALSFAQAGLARVFAVQGDLVAALDMYGKVLADARANLAADPRLKATVATPLEAIGEIYYRLGNTDQARANFEEARKLSDGDPPTAGRISASLGVTELTAGRFEAALAAYVESRTRFEQAKQPDDVARAWVGIGFSHAAREKFDEAITAYRTAIRMFEASRSNGDSGRAWLGLSMAQSGKGEHEAALASALTVRTIAATVDSADLAWRASVRAGEALRSLKRLDEAQQEFRRAIEAIDALAAVAPINPEAREQLDDSASAWTGLAFTLASMSDARGALEAIEARRAHVRRVQLAPFHRDITRGMTPEEEADEHAIVRDLISVRAQVRAEKGLPHPDDARLQRLQERMTALGARRGEQQAKLYARLPDLQQWRALTPVPFELGLALADDRSLIVEYLVSDDELLTVTAASGEDGPDVRALVVPFKRRELADQIAKAMQSSVLADVAEWQKQSSAIATTLLGAIGERLSGRDRCTIVPDDLLWKVPFEALVIGDAPLAARVRVGYATSLVSMTVEARAIADRQTPATIAAALFAAPVIPDAVRTQLTLAQTGWKAPDEIATLRAATDEARPYGESASVKSNVDATESALRSALGSADVLHLAAPFHASGASPMFSMVVLAGTGEQLDNDGRWEVREWFRSSSRASVAIIADGSSFGGAGVAGAMDTLAWASASLGVPVLVVARWPSDGFSNDAVFAAFHVALAKGTSPIAAWTSAVGAARTKNAAPAAWAGARLIGAAGRE
jgi:tetratricopeptide (TPR) repeat protein